MAAQVLRPRGTLPAAVAAVLLGTFVLPLGLALPRLKVDNAAENYFPPTAAAVVIERELRQVFPDDDLLIGLFAGEELFSDHFIQALDNVARELEPLPLVDRVLTLTTVDHITAIEDGFEVELLIDPLRLDETTPTERRARVLGDRFAPGLLVNEEGSAVALVVRSIELEDSRQRIEVEDAFREAVVREGIEPALVAIAGTIPLDVELFRSMQRDNAIFVPFTSALGLLVFWWILRRPLGIVLGMVAIAAVLVWSVSLYVLMGWNYTLVASVLPPLLSALTIALLIHFYNALAHADARGYVGEERVWRAVEAIRRPARYTTLTTAAGLGSLGLSPIIPIAHFGIGAAVGLGILYFVVMVLLPPLFARWDRRPWSSRRSGLRWVGRAVSRLADVGIRRAGTVLVVTALGLAVGLPFIWRVESESDLYRFFDPRHRLIEDTRRVEAELSGVTNLEIIFRGPGRDSLTDPRRLEAIRQFQQWVEGLADVDRSLSMADVVEEMHWAFHGQDPDFRTVPSSGTLISQYLFVYGGDDLYELVNRELDQTRVPLNLNVSGARATSAVMDRIRDYLGEADLAGLEWEIGGGGRIFADYADLLITGQVRSLLGALGIIFLLMVVLWRSLLQGALTMIPNLAPVLFIFVLMGALNIWLDIATAVIACVAVGIAVDDTIHFFHGYWKRRRQGTRTTWALARSYRQAGRAVTATTLILAVQFGALAFSNFVPMSQFGLLTSVGIVGALVFDLLLLPAILVAIDRGRRGAGVTSAPGP